MKKDFLDAYLKLQALKTYITIQSLDDSLWFEGKTEIEKRLRNELQSLINMIEDSSWETILKEANIIIDKI